MSDKAPTGNPIFDIWLDNQEQFLNAQSQWLTPGSSADNPYMNAGFLDRSMKSWQHCEEQYNHWMSAAENWVSGSQGSKDGEEDEDYAAQALTYLINPTTFMQSGFEMMDQVFRKLVNGPEFADIGMLEKKVMKTGQDWQAFKDAGQSYQEVISGAWLRAYQRFSDEFFERMQDENISTEETLKRWLQIADEELVATLRSEDFLAAQRNFFTTGTAYKLKYREFAEMWCESHTIPTRTEVDDLHKIIYELRREVRALKRQVDKQGKDITLTQTPVKKAAKKSAKTKAPTKARQSPVKKAGTNKG